MYKITAEASIKLVKERKCDDRLLCQIRGEDLCTKEPQYHN